MPIADFNTYKTLIQTSDKIVTFNKPGVTTGNSGPINSNWVAGGDTTGVAPTTAVAPSHTTAGALTTFPNILAGNKLFLGMAEVFSASNNAPTTVILVDRLSHQGGLSGTSIAAQTTNLPTAALTRYTSGEGVMIALESYVNLGATATTATVSYTNSAGTAGRTSQPVTMGFTGTRDPTYTAVVPLQTGDTGVQSVQSVTLAASTGAGTFGVTLFKPICVFNNVGISGGFSPGSGCYFDDLVKIREILPTACLALYVMPVISTTTGGMIGQFTFLETT